MNPIPRGLSLAAVLLLSACTGESTDRATLRFSVLPDFHKAATDRNAEQLAQYLTRKLGRPVEYLRANDYPGAVNNLIANKVDFVWLGGKTTCDAIDAGAGHVHVLATRDIDLAFKSYFIANKQALDAGRIQPLAKLEDLKPLAADLTFTFGDQNSTSGHLMPRYFLSQAGIDPERDFRSSGYRPTGSHGATLAAVKSGEVDLGALNFGHYDQASAQDKAAAPIVYTTPPYVDYAWVGHDRIGADLMRQLTAAFTGMDRANAEDEAILDTWQVDKGFVVADDARWDDIRKVRDSLPKGFLK